MRPVILVIMDGVGLGGNSPGDAVSAASTPNLNILKDCCPKAKLKAHGTAVGLPSDGDMGNSEVGHNALGCGQIYSQGALLVNESLQSGAVFKSQAWLDIAKACTQPDAALHLIGLLSDGNVHSHISHLKALLRQAKAEGIRKARVHILLDGRDVPALSALDYVNDLEGFLSELSCESFDCKIASGGGRMKITMDRYEAEWNMVARGWDTHVRGIGRAFQSAAEAIEAYRAELGVIDQDLPPFVIEGADGRIKDGDGVIFFNFRGDRAIEISMAFDYQVFDGFDRGPRPNVVYAGMLQYDGDLKLPARYLVEPPAIKNTLTELLVENKIAQFAVSETQKYGHVTYFWNGNRSGKTDEALEDFVEITSDTLPFDQRPWMKCAEITDALITSLKTGKYGFLRLNYPNGDMVGHTGNFNATRLGVEAVDLCLGRIIEAAREEDAILLVTADHGNADEMFEKGKDGKIMPKTSHSLNPVPFILFDPGAHTELIPGNYSLANVTPTIARLLGLKPFDSWEQPMI